MDLQPVGESSSRSPLLSGQTHQWAKVPAPEKRVGKAKAGRKGSSTQQARIEDHTPCHVLGEETSKIFSSARALVLKGAEIVGRTTWRT